MGCPQIYWYSLKCDWIDMRKNKIIAVAFCLIIAALTIARLFIDSTTFIGMIIRGAWLVSGAFSIVLAIIHLVKTKK